MTGFGKTTVEIKNKKIVIEIKSLNSKQLDLNLRMPALYKEKEMEIRSMVKEGLDRGKVDMAVYFDSSESDRAVAINRAVVEQYFGQLTEIAAQLGVEPDKNALLQTIMRFPDTLQVQAEQLDEEEWQALRAGITQALAEIDKFRIQEGRALIRDIAHRIDQEIIYYLEKLDITEEKVRLANHCNYFMETVEQEEAPGRKIGFIAQEIGREINTMGSKANDHDIQKLVVRMKDELEKIKEQSLNVL